MNYPRHFTLMSCLCACLVGSACAQAATQKEPAKGRTNSVPAFTLVDIPQSVFVIPSTPKEGRNPFFPNSVATAPVVKAKTSGVVDLTGIMLNGITSPPRRTAMINGRTFEPGEEGEIKLPNGSKVLLKCEEIGADSTIIQINGARRELKLRFGL